MHQICSIRLILWQKVAYHYSAFIIGLDMQSKLICKHFRITSFFESLNISTCLILPVIKKINQRIRLNTSRNWTRKKQIKNCKKRLRIVNLGGKSPQKNGSLNIWRVKIKTRKISLKISGKGKENKFKRIGRWFIRKIIQNVLWR